MKSKLAKYRRNLIIGKIIVWLFCTLFLAGGVYNLVVKHDNTIVGMVVIFGLLGALLFVSYRSQKNYLVLMNSLPSDHKLIDRNITAVDIGNFRFIYHVYGKEKYFKSYLCLTVPIPFPINDHEAEKAITEDLAGLIRELNDEGVLSDAVDLVRMDTDSNSEGDDDAIWTGQPFFVEFPYKVITSERLTAIQGRVVDIINKYNLQDIEYCEICGTERGSDFSLFKGNMFISSVSKDAFDGSFYRCSRKSTHRMVRSKYGAYYDVEEYYKLYEDAKDSKDGVSFDDLEGLIKTMSRGTGNKTEISYDDKGICVRVTIPSIKSASEYRLANESGYWWIHSHGRLDNIFPISNDDEAAACDIFLKILDNVIHIPTDMTNN